MTTIYEYYVMDEHNQRRYFKDMREANEYAKEQANLTGRTSIRYDIHGGQAWFYPVEKMYAPPGA